MSNDFDIQDDMQGIIDDFLVEADELINSLDENLVTLESQPDNIDLLNEIFRAAHTIKGASSFLGLDQVTTLTHKMEDILNKLRRSEMVVTAEIMDILLQSLDILKQLIENVRNGDLSELDLKDIYAGLDAVLQEESGEQPAPSDDTESQGEVPGEVDAVADEPEHGFEIQDEHEEDPDSQASAKKQVQPQVHAKTVREQTIRVDVERLDTLMNMMGELVLGRNSVVQSVNDLLVDHEGDYNLEQLSQATNSINFITTELQMAVMKMRMQPVGKVFKKFPRLVRDLARDLKKEINLEIYGETTELDRSVIEEIGDPLVHIIRNSCDHGIESPEERETSGKPRMGTVRLEAAQEGSNIVITIKDDGKGLDVDVIRTKAVERKLISAADAAKLSNKEVFRFIFEAGFSTAQQVTDVSGRGVGMDVVRTNIEKLSGFVDIESTKGEGTTLSIKLPLTLAIIQGLLVESDNDVYILPLSSVHETVKTETTDVYYINQRPVFRLREEIIPIVNLNDTLKGQSSRLTMTEKKYIVVVGLAEKKLGIMIDNFLGQEEVVIKSMGSYLGSTDGVAGATILGDGRIRLIVDIIGLFNIANKNK